MQFHITHDIPGRMRLRSGMYSFTLKQSVSLEELFGAVPGVRTVQANYRTGSLLILYQAGIREKLLALSAAIRIRDLPEPKGGTERKEIEEVFVRDLCNLCIRRFIFRPLLPPPVRVALTLYDAAGFFRHGLSELIQGRVTTPVLDASAIGASLIQREVETAGSIMFLLKISELLEEYTKKRTTNALVQSLAINVERVWKLSGGEEVSVPFAEVAAGDTIVVRTGCTIPVDGYVTDGEALVNESSMTGEPLPAEKSAGSSVYAGCVVDEGCIAVEVRALDSETRVSRIIGMIADSESLKADVQSKAERMADAIVPYSFLAAAGVFVLTGNVTRALSVLMVDYSCALKLSTPISVISAMAEASNHRIMVKGGKFLEEYALADTVVFDKTGTLTVADPRVTGIVAFSGYTPDEVLKNAACLEEHFPHSVARAVVRKAEEEGLKHREEHAEVEYVVAHGIASMLHQKRMCIGSAHFLFEDEGISCTPEQQEIIDRESDGCSVIYLSIGDTLAGFLCIEDSIRPEAKEVVAKLRDAGITRIVMLTGDGEAAARNVCRDLGITDCCAQVLPEEKAVIVERLKAEGRRVIMVGDGINDSPALAAAHVSVAMKDASDIAREVADITLLASDLHDLVTLRRLSVRVLNRINTNYRFILGFNTSLLILGQFGILTPMTTALLHNVSTMGISAYSMQPLLETPV